MLPEFSFLYTRSIINKHTEKIIGRILEEQIFNKQLMLVYDVEHIAEIYHIPIVENLKTRFAVSSIYLDNKKLYIDWSLPAYGEQLHGG